MRRRRHFEAVSEINGNDHRVDVVDVSVVVDDASRDGGVRVRARRGRRARPRVVVVVVVGNVEDDDDDDEEGVP